MDNKLNIIVEKLPNDKPLTIHDQTFISEKLLKKNLQFAVLTRLTFFEIKFENIDLNNASFFNCKFNNCSFTHVNLLNCKFSDTIFKNCHFKNANLTKANFSRGILQNSTFMNSNLTASNFSNLKLMQLKFEDTNLNLINAQSIKFWDWKLKQWDEIEGSYNFEIFLKDMNCDGYTNQKIRYNYQKYVELIKYKNSLIKQNKNFQDENYLKYLELLEYSVQISDYLHWSRKDDYFQLIADFLNLKITGKTFDSKFCTMFEAIEKTYQLLTENYEMLKYIKPSSISFEFATWVLEIYYCCEEFAFDKNEEKFRNEVIDIFPRIQKYKSTN